ncbi:MAG: glutamate 5-kinase [bacterium]|nr:glutamate 5-kinase [bacterium]
MTSERRIVVKLGTSTLTAGTPHLSRQRMLEIVQQIARLHQQGHEMLVVSSGAQAAGRERLGFPDLGRALPAKQMLAAVGQGRLMQLYGDLFDIFGIAVGQVLLTRDDLSHRTRYLNARDTLLTLIEQRVIPIINENDTVATEEIRVGDNDNLSALVASVVEADLLVLLTDIAGLYSADPRRDSSAQLIPFVPRIDEATYALAGGTGSKLGTGGMLTKIEAAHTASRSGVTTVIASGSESNVLARVVNGDEIGTRFAPVSSAVESRKRWLLTDKAQGIVRVDAGAAAAITGRSASLLPVGITQVEGDFVRGATVSVRDPNGLEIAHGLSNYGSEELRKLPGMKSSQIADVLGYSYGDHVIHRNNMVVLA